jgi:hypothetical protein
LIAAARAAAVAVVMGAMSCSVYRASYLDEAMSRGGAPQGGASSGGTRSHGGNGAGAGNGGTAPAAGTSSGGSASAGDGSGGSTTSGGTAMEGGSTNSGGEGGGDPGPDDCPEDPEKRQPGVCGCGIPDVSNAELANCQSLKEALIHRYDFEGTGTAVTDRVGDANGTVVGATLSRLEGRGVVTLTGGTSGPYVDLPNRLVSSLTSVTLESWITWKGGPPWQRIFDFGDTTATSPENNPAAGKTYLFATPQSEDDVALASYSHEGNDDGQQLEATASAPLGTALSQVVVVANGVTHKLVLYIDGDKISEQGWTGSLSLINDVNVWLGRSQYTQDPELNAVFHDFRVYDAPLTDAQVATAYLGGTDPAFFEAETTSSLASPTVD